MLFRQRVDPSLALSMPFLEPLTHDTYTNVTTFTPCMSMAMPMKC